MVVYNAGSKELTAKIVYYGPGLGGKTTNLQFLHRRLEPSSVGNLLTLAATADRTIFFDLLPVELGELKGYRIRFQVATVPGQSPYNETRRVVLRGVDGIVFVVDSRWSMLPKNLESFQNLKDNLKEEGVAIESLPVVVQFNKRDLPDVLAIDALQEGLGLGSLPYIEAVASDGKGVVETFKLISKLTFVDILRRLQKKGVPREPRPSAVPLSEVSNPAAWKSTVENLAAPAPLKAVPAAMDSEISQDESATRAIPIPAAFARPEPEAPRTALESPFFSPDDTNPALRLASERQDAIVQETFAPFPESPLPLREDTNPTFFPRATEPPAPSASTTDSFPEITSPMSTLESMSILEEQPVPPGPAPEPPAEDFPPAAEAAEEPADFSWIPQPVTASIPDTARAERDSKLAELAESLSTLEGRISQIDEIASRLERLEARMTRFEGARPWVSEIDDLRTSVANQKLGAEKGVGELRSAVDKLQREVADASSREMELVAQISRESLGVAASLEKLGFRIRDTEEKFSQLAVDQESRLSRLERLIEEQAERGLQEQESQRRTVLELREALHSARLEAQERFAGMESLRETLSSTLGDLADRLRRAVNASGQG